MKIDCFIFHLFGQKEKRKMFIKIGEKRIFSFSFCARVKQTFQALPFPRIRSWPNGKKTY
jgi:hypothetical protein